MLKKIAWSVLWVTLLILKAHAQDLTIEYTYKNSKQLDSIFFDIHKPVSGNFTDSDQLYKIKKKEFFKGELTSKTVCTYEIKDTTCAFIEDGFGHELIIIPNDTIRIFLQKQNDISPPDMLNKDYRSPWLFSFTYSGKNQYIHSLFDSLAYNAGAVNLDMVERADNAEDKFIKSVDDRYSNRISYLNIYCKRHYLSNSIQSLVRSEIYAAYVQNLMFLYTQQNLQPQTKDLTQLLIRKININEIKPSYFFKTLLSQEAIYEYITILKTNFDHKLPFGRSHLLNGYNSLKRYCHGNILDNLLTRHMQLFISNGDDPYIDTLIKSYNVDCRNHRYVLYIDSLYKAQKAAVKITYNDVVNTTVKDINGKSILLKDAFNGRPTLIDCWASWCKPCIGQFGYAKKIEKIYSGKVNFLYLSFDKNPVKWKLKIHELNLDEINYIVPNNFKSNIANYFKLNTIPRYILINKNGELVNADSPRPSEPELMTLIADLLK